MEIVEDELATVAEARAFQLQDVLVVQLAGTRPSACHVVTLERALTDVEPPAFVARMTIDPRARCAPLEQPFDATQAFRVGAARSEALVHHAGGQLTVPVQRLEPGAGAAAQRAGAGAMPAELPGGVPHEAVGYSKAWDLQEAMRDAISQLPGNGIADWLYRYRVVEIGADVGGVAGLNQLRVTVRGG